MGNFSGIQNYRSGNANLYPSVSNKALGTNPKALGGQAGGISSELVNWYEQAYAYYNAVVSGAEAAPNAQAWQGFLEQMNWAAGQLGYQGVGNEWNPAMGGGSSVGPNAMGAPEGAILGTMENVVWNQEAAHIVAQGDSRAQDIWSNDVTIDVLSLSATVTGEITIDPRLSPPEEVLKIIVKDPATGNETVYFVHDYQDAQIKIQSPEEKQLHDSSGTGLITWNRYEATGGSESARPDASIEGKVQEDGTIVYEPEYAGETVDFWNNPGESHTRVVYADTNISVKPSDETDIRLEGDVVKVTVTSMDGTVNVYLVQKGYKVNVNANEEYVTFSGDGPELRARATVNGGVEDSSEPSPADATIESILSATDRPLDEHGEAQLLNALKAAGYGYTDIEDFKTAISSGEFPGNPPDAKLFHFLSIIDPELSKQYSKNDDREALNERLVELIQILYPDHIVSGYGKNPQMMGFEIDGEGFTIGYPEDNDHPVVQED